MSSYRELLQAVKAEIEEADASGAQTLVDEGAVLVDVRERDEWEQGRIPGAVHVPRGNLESRIEQAAPDRARPVVLYCAAGNRSAFAAKTLRSSATSGRSRWPAATRDWQRNGLPTDLPRTLGPARQTRYSRHLLIPEVGEEGQLRLLDSRILLIGAGGLGSPASLYLAAAGVGKLGIVDADVVDETNLQRQIAHSTDSLGEPKTDSARRRIESLNPDVEVVPFRERLTSENVERILEPGWDVIVDGADNFPTRYLVNDASVWHDIPVVHGSIFRFEGQVTVFKPGAGPCYRCLFRSRRRRHGAELRGGRRARRAAGRDRLDSGYGGAEARARDRRAARRAAAALRRALGRVRRDEAAPRSGLPGLRRVADDHGLRRLRRVLPGGRALSRVRIPPTLRAETAGEREVEASGRTVRELLDDLMGRFPALRGQLLEDDELAPFVNVYVEGEDVRTRDGLDTPVDEGSQVILLPAMAGG